MEDYILISTLNDFIFCPYSIYLHNVYMDTDESLYHAYPQTIGKLSHKAIDDKTYSNKLNDITALSVYSNELGIMGKIDLYKQKEGILIERKYKLSKIFIGQIYQLWAQYFCMTEMGYKINKLAFYEISTNKMDYINIPTENSKNELKNFISKFKNYKPENDITVNQNKCSHCIYCNMCDKIDIENVF